MNEVKGECISEKQNLYIYRILHKIWFKMVPLSVTLNRLRRDKKLIQS